MAFIPLWYDGNGIIIDSTIRWYDGGASGFCPQFTYTKTPSLDAYLQKTFTKTLSLDAYLLAIPGLWTFLDGVLEALGVTKTTSLDSYLQSVGINPKTISLDSLLNKVGNPKTISLDSLLNKVGKTKTASLDSLLEVIAPMSKQVANGTISVLNNIKISWVSGNSFIALGGVDLSPYAGTDSGNTKYMIKITDTYGHYAWGFIGAAGTGESLGSELLANPNFDSNVNGWTGYYATPSLAAGGQNGNCCDAIMTGGNYSNVYSTFNITEGVLYKASGYVSEPGGGGPALTASIEVDSISALFYGSSIPVVKSAWTQLNSNYMCVPKGQGGTGYGTIRVKIGGSMTGEFMIDTMSVKPVNECDPTGVHIVSSLNGTTRNWAYMDSNYFFNAPCVYTVYAIPFALLDAYLQKTKTDTVSLDSVLRALGVTKTTSLDADLQKLGVTKTTSLDSYLETMGLTRQSSIDAYLKKVGLPVTASLDAILISFITYSVEANLDAYLQKTMTRTASLDGYATKTNTKITGLDSLLQKIKALSASLDGYLYKTHTMTSALDAYLYKTRTGSLVLDGFLFRTITKSLVLDALLNKTGKTVITALDSYLSRSRTVQTALDGYLYAIHRAGTSLDALLKKLNKTLSVGLDGYLTQKKTLSLGLDSLLFVERLVSLDLDAFLTKVMKIAAGLDSVVCPAFFPEPSYFATSVLEVSSLASAVERPVLKSTMEAPPSFYSEIEREFYSVLDKESSLSEQ